MRHDDIYINSAVQNQYLCLCKTIIYIAILSIHFDGCGKCIIYVKTRFLRLKIDFPFPPKIERRLHSVYQYSRFMRKIPKYDTF